MKLFYADVCTLCASPPGPRNPKASRKPRSCCEHYQDQVLVEPGKPWIGPVIGGPRGLERHGHMSIRALGLLFKV